MDHRKPLLPYVLSAVAGLVICLAITATTGRSEAWDSGLYYAVGIPLMCAAIFIIAFLFPHKPWRWTLAMAAGQAASALFGGSSLSLWPLALIFMTIISIPQFASGWFGARLARHYSVKD